LPSATMVQGWHRKAPADFRFVLKGSRFVTHIKRLGAIDDALKTYFQSVKALSKQTGAILWQLPPSMQKDAARLEDFLAKLPRSYRHAIEFRYPSWLDDDVFDLLHRHQAACVWISSLRMPRDFTCTTDFVYARFHGLAGGVAHDYTKAELRPWAKALSAAAQSGKPSYAYFNNDGQTRAPFNAQTLMAMVAPYSVPPFVPRENAPAARARRQE